MFSIYVTDIATNISESDIRTVNIGKMEGKLVINLYMKTLKSYLIAEEKFSKKFITDSYDIRFDRPLYLIRISAK